MSGRYSGWRRLSGDTVERPDLLDYGKKLLAYLDNQRALGAPPTLTIRHVMDDGSEVMARFVGDMPQIEIHAADGSGETTAPPVFACNPRSDEHPNGIDPAWTQVGLTPRAGLWGAWFGSKTAGNAVAPPTGLYRRAFKDGIKRGGNCDWRGASGVVVSFYGPTLRYLYDPYRKPDAQYGKCVFMNGAAVLDIAAYDLANSIVTPENLVVGATLADGYLYVMQANIGPFSDDPGAEFAGTTPDGASAWISPVYPPGDTDLKLFRYAVSRVPTSATKADQAVVVDGSRELLWSKTARGYVNPWVANPTATKWETFAMPAETRFVEWGDYAGSYAQITQVVVMTPSDSSKHTTLTIGASSVTETTIDVSHVVDGTYDAITGPGDGTFNITATFAADYDAQGNRIEASIRMHSERIAGGVVDRSMFLSVGGVEHTLLNLRDGIYNYYGSQIMAMDLRYKAVALLTRASPHWLWRVIVNDVVVHASDTGYPTSMNGTSQQTGTVFSFNGRSAGYFMLELPFFATPSPDATVLPLSPLVWAYMGTATKAINYVISIGVTGTRYTALHNHLAAYSPLTTPNAELVLKSNTIGGASGSWLSGSGSFPLLNRADDDGHVVPCSLIVDNKGNWIFSGVAGLHYSVATGGSTDHRLRFPTFWASATDLTTRTGIGHAGAGEPTNTYGPMWLFSNY